MQKAGYLLKSMCVAGLALSAAGPVMADDKKPVLRVLSYNINGLPAPLKKNKRPLYERIAEILRDRREAGTQPHVVVLQEAFDKGSRIVADTSGYSYAVKGPGRRDTSKAGSAHWTQGTRRAYAQRPTPQKITGSGLYILSDFPIVDAKYKAFDSDACAGLDCLSNKAIQFARIETPFASEPIDIVNSHFNSRGSAKAPGKITLKAHKRQTDTLAKFLDQFRTGHPIVIAGDFNTKQDKRYAYFREHVPLVDAGESCLGNKTLCLVAEGTREDELLYRTNDKQFYDGNETVSLTPIWMARNFDELLDGRPLSDHLGYEVHYEVTVRD